MRNFEVNMNVYHGKGTSYQLDVQINCYLTISNFGHKDHDFDPLLSWDYCARDEGQSWKEGFNALDLRYCVGRRRHTISTLALSVGRNWSRELALSCIQNSAMLDELFHDIVLA